MNKFIDIILLVFLLISTTMWSCNNSENQQKKSAKTKKAVKNSLTNNTKADSGEKLTLVLYVPKNSEAERIAQGITKELALRMGIKITLYNLPNTRSLYYFLNEKKIPLNLLVLLNWKNYTLN